MRVLSTRVVGHGPFCGTMSHSKVARLRFVGHNQVGADPTATANDLLTRLLLQRASSKLAR